MQKIQEIISSINTFLDTHWYTLITVCVSIAVLMIVLHEIKKHYLIHINEKYIKGLKWKVFELKFPKENLKSPKAMEQVFASLHASYSFGLNNRQIWWDGEVEQWFSLEIVGRSHEVRFYIRCQAGAKNAIEAAFFSQYPELEIIEVPDYMESMPKVVPNETYDLMGADLLLARDDFYPIKTYDFFESPDEEKQLDPIATLMEAAAGLKEDEVMLIQILCRPSGIGTNPGWLKEGEKKLNKLTGAKAPDKEPGFMYHVGQFFGNIFKAGLGEEIKWGVEKKEDKGSFKMYSPIDTELMKVMGEKMARQVFDSIIRIIYLDRKDAFSSKNFGAMMAAFAQFGTGSYNSFKPNMATFTKGNKVGGHDRKGGQFPWTLFFRKKRLLARKKKLYHAYIEREMPQFNHRRPYKNYTGYYHKIGTLHLDTSILAIHELATVFHPPGHPVAAQKLGQLPGKKSGPPAGLPLID